MTPQSQSAERFPHLARVTRYAAFFALSMGLALTLPACATDFDASSEFADVDDAENVTTAEQSLITDSTVNLALNKPASQSSVAFGCDASRAVDGNTSGDWNDNSITYSLLENNPWWQVDLGSVQKLGTISLFNPTDFNTPKLADFKVLVSDDGVTNWRVGAMHYGATATQVRLNLVDRATGGPIRGRYVRVQISGTTTTINLAEVQIYPPAPVNLAYKKQVSQSSTYNPDGIASHAVDGKTDGVWSNLSVTHTNYEYQPWWKVDLGSQQPIAGIVLWNRTDCCSNRLANFRVMLSNDNATWTSYNHPGTVQTSATFSVNATARYVAVQLNDWGILSLAEVHVLGAPESERVRSVDLGGATPEVTKYLERWEESRTLDPFLEPADRHFKGDFMGIGREQMLHVNRDGNGDKRLQILDYGTGAAGGTSLYGEPLGAPHTGGWIDDNDIQLAGDFRGLGHSQLMFINRTAADGKVMILDYAGATTAPAIKYLERWGDSTLLNGWIDNDDLQLSGDFLGIGRSQVMFINRGGTGGKLMIVDYAGIVPGYVRAIESWGQSYQLNGWLDNDDLQFVGDFMGLGRSQVMFINRGGTGGKVMIVDFAMGFPGVVLYWETWGQTYQLSGWIDNGDVQLVGDFTGVGHDQLLLFNAKNESNGKLQVLDYANTWPATVRYSQSWTQTGELSDWPAPGDILFAGKFTNSARADLLAHHVGKSTTYTATNGNPAACPAAHLNVPSGCVPGCPAGQELLGDASCVTKVLWNGGDLPPDARVVLQATTRLKKTNSIYPPYEAATEASFEAFGPAWVIPGMDLWGNTVMTANATPLTRDHIFTVESFPSTTFPNAVALRLPDGRYLGKNQNGSAMMLVQDWSNRVRVGYFSNYLVTLMGTYPHHFDEFRSIIFADYYGMTVAGTNQWNDPDHTHFNVFLVD